MTTMRRRPTATAIAVAAAGAVVLGVIATGVIVQSVGAAAGTERAAVAPAASTSATAPASDPSRPQAVAPQDPSAAVADVVAADAVPTRIRIPSIGVDAPMETLTTDAAGQLAAPVDWDAAGWFRDGPVPGRIGPSVIAGHVDSTTGPAVFARLDQLVAGDAVSVELSDGTSVEFRVTGAMQSPKALFPTSDVYSAVPRPELRLITCGGTFDGATGHYTDNLIVFAALTT